MHKIVINGILSVMTEDYHSNKQLKITKKKTQIIHKNTLLIVWVIHYYEIIFFPRQRHPKFFKKRKIIIECCYFS